MPSPEKGKSSQTKKTRLGRGLGSLLSTDMQDFEPGKDKSVKPQGTEKTKVLKKSPEQAKGAGSQKNEAKGTQVSTHDQSGANTQNQVVEKVSDFKRIWIQPIDKVHPNKRQPRKDFEKGPLAELSHSIKEQGILQPITVRRLDDGFEIIAGERRWRAAQMAGLHEVPVIIKDVDDQKVMELALIENIQREDLNAVEEAIAYQQLIEDYHLSQEDVAKKVGKSRSTITNSLRMLLLPKEVKRALRSHEISVGHAKILLSVDDPKKQLEFLKIVIAGKMSVRALEKEIKKKPVDNKSIGELDVSERLAQALAVDLQKTLGTKVKIQYNGGKGKIEISYYTDDELTRFSERIKETWQKHP